MAITSYPFDTQIVTESQYSQLFREFADSGVAASSTSNSFSVSADGSTMTVKVQPGFAIVRGHAVLSTAVESLTIPTAGTSTRYDRVVLRLDPAANSITLAVLQGTAGGSVPAPTQTETGVYELPLATVTVAANITAVASAAVDKERAFVGNSVGAWVTRTRPAAPRFGKLGLNYDTNVWEYWDGAAWTPLVASVSWSSLTGKPSAFPPSTHTHAWADLTGRPASLPPTAHKHPWSDVTGTPSTYPPSTHSHSWSSITSKPSTFPPTSHSHSSYLESGDTISWANGSKRPHSSSVGGSGTYYAVWVDGTGRFGRNTSSLRYKQNVRDVSVAPSDVLALRPRLYDRLPDEDGGEYARDEFGLIAEEVAETLPEIVTYDEEGRIDALRYDLLGVALLPVVQDQAARIARLEARVEELARAA
ncbi:tail fiber domain-containing protein [Streptomyces sp. NPDC057552]|uniref:tail fiber domain-containing protein n=1 Tax=Streptomyces sp. NPDC057552 TaxID=3350537 RepID=UPI0036942FE5